MTLYNPGTVDSKPLIQITHTGDLTITIGEMTQTFTDIDGTILVDCEADIVTDNQGVIWFGATAPFLRIPVGESTVTLSDSATVTIQPRWRWY
jgi:phage-related protein